MAIMLGVYVKWLFARQIGGDLKEVMLTMKKIADGDLSIRLEVAKKITAVYCTARRKCCSN